MSTQAYMPSNFSQDRIKNNETVPVKTSQRKNKNNKNFDIYAVDLGTMGIPREVAHHNAN